MKILFSISMAFLLAVFFGGSCKMGSRDGGSQNPPPSLLDCAKAHKRDNPEQACDRTTHSGGYACTFVDGQCIAAIECSQLTTTKCNERAIAHKKCARVDPVCVEQMVCEDIADMTQCDGKYGGLGSYCRVLPVKGEDKCITFYKAYHTHSLVSSPDTLVALLSVNNDAPRYYTFGKAQSPLFAIPNDVRKHQLSRKDYACGLTENGEPRCWGNATKGQLNPPPYKFSKIVGSDEYACGLVKDGEPNANKIACWGAIPAQIRAKLDGDFMSISHTHTVTFADVSFPTTATLFKDVAIASEQLCAVSKQNLAPYGGGGNYNGEGYIYCSHDWTYRAQSAVFEKGFFNIFAGNHHFCAINNNNKAVCWTSENDANKNMQSGVYFTENNDPHKSKKEYKSVAMTDDYACFSPKYANEVTEQLCMDTGSNAHPLAGKFSHVTLQNNFGCGVTEDNKIQCWGPEAADIMETVPAVLK